MHKKDLYLGKCLDDLAEMYVVDLSTVRNRPLQK